MARTEQSLTLTDSYRQHLLQLRLQASRQVAASWQTGIDPTNLDASYAAWATGAAALLEAYKRQGVAASDGYLAAYLSSELVRHVAPRGLDPDPYMLTIDGRPVREALLSPLFTVKLAVKQGRSVEVGLHLGLVRATRTAAVETLDAPRRALGDLMAEDDRIEGWRRATSANPCGACLALATNDTHDPLRPLPTHDHCRCVTEPVIRHVPDNVRRPTGRQLFDSMSREQQDALFHGRGGAQKAELIRSGAVPLEALIERDPMTHRPDQFTEAPLSALHH